MHHKKILGLWLVLTAVFLMAGCGMFDNQDSTCEEGYIMIEGQCHVDLSDRCGVHESYDPITNSCIDTRTYVDILREDPATFRVNPAHHVSSHAGQAPLDYSDDERTLWDVDDFQDDTVIVFPDPIFHQAVLDELRFDEDQDITFADVQSLDVLAAHGERIKSIEGIELFTNLTGLYLGELPYLASIRGADVLPNLQKLFIQHTGVRTIDFGPSAFPALTHLYIDYTNIAVDGYQDLLAMLDDYTDHLEVLSVKGIDNIRFSSAPSPDSQDFEVNINLGQIDFETFDVRSLLVEEDYYGRDTCSNPSNIGIDILAPTNTVLFNNDHSCRDKYYFRRFFGHIQTHMRKLNINPEMDEATKVFLIYQYVFDLFKDNRHESTESSSDSDATRAAGDKDWLNDIISGGPIQYAESSLTLFKILLAVHDIEYMRISAHAIHGTIEPPTPYYSYKVGGYYGPPLSVRLDDNQFYYIDLMYNLSQYWEGNTEHAHTFFLTGSASFTEFHQTKIDELPADMQGDYTSIGMDDVVSVSDYSVDLLLRQLPDGIVTTEGDPVDVHRVFLQLEPNSEPVIAYLKEDGSPEGITLDKPHYRFLGLYTDEARTVPLDPSTRITDDMHLYAEWERITYQIGFDTESDETLDPLTTHFHDLRQLPVLEKQNFIFTGWMLGESPVDRMYTFDRDRDITLTASWEPSASFFGYQYSDDTEGERLTLTSISRDVDVLLLPDDLNIALDGSERKAITAIGSDLLSGSSIKHIRLGHHVDTIGSHAFSDTTRLSYIQLPLGIHTIEADAFSGSSAKILVDVSIDTSTFDEGWDNDVSVIRTQGDVGVHENMVYVLTEDHDIMILGMEDPSKASSLTIPETIDGHPVTTIADHFAAGNTQLTEIILPDTITHIGASAFDNCVNLNDVSFSDDSGLLEIGDRAFENTAIAAIDLPNTLETIGDAAFGHTPIDRIIIPASVTHVGVGFMPEDIDIIYFKGAVDAISNASFETDYTSWIDRFDFETDDGVFTYVFRTDDTAYVSGMKDDIHPTVLEIPASVEGRMVTGIMPYAFHDNDVMRKITLPNTIASIGEAAFQNTSVLAEIVFEEDMTLDHLGDRAFAEIPHLGEIHDFPGVTAIASFTFSDTPLVLIEFSEGLKTIDTEAFKGNRVLRAVHFPSTIESIAPDTFDVPVRIIYTTALQAIPDWFYEAGLREKNGTANMRSIDVPKAGFITGIDHEGRSWFLRYWANSGFSTELFIDDGFYGIAHHAFLGLDINSLIFTGPPSHIDPSAFHHAIIDEITLRFPVPETFPEDWNHDGTDDIPYRIDENPDDKNPEEDE